MSTPPIPQTAPGTGPTFVKGHGTENDFVVLLDPDGSFGLTDRQVRALCDRHRGFGADGVLRAIPADDGTDWFMDYRNADGSLAEMCGNGARVFGRALRDAGLVASDAFTVQTRGGARRLTLMGDDVSVSMGVAITGSDPVTVGVGASRWDATSVWVPNPHAVAFVDDLADAGDLAGVPKVSPLTSFPDGVNVEFVVERGPAHVEMRVHERGVGQTRSCGTGAVAVAWVWRRRSGTEAATVRVDVPGGTVWVTEHDDGHLDLVGPAVLVARGAIDEQWWKEHA